MSHNHVHPPIGTLRQQRRDISFSFFLGDTVMRLVCTPTTCLLCIAVIIYDKMIIRDHPSVSQTHSHCGLSPFFCQTSWKALDHQRLHSLFVVGWRVLIYDRRASGARLNPPFDDVILRLTLAIPSHAGALHCNIFLICSPRELKCSMDAYTRAEMLNGRTPQR